jgi:hypothetical protein
MEVAMHNDEATALLKQKLDQYRRTSYETLASRIAAGQLRSEAPGAAGNAYQIEILCVWDDRPGGDVRVIGSIDDGGWRAFVPLTDSFIKRSDGSLVGE